MKKPIGHPKITNQSGTTIIRCHAILMKDDHGQIIYTFDDKKKADEFYRELTK